MQQSAKALTQQYSCLMRACNYRSSGNWSKCFEAELSGATFRRDHFVFMHPSSLTRIAIGPRSSTRKGNSTSVCYADALCLALKLDMEWLSCAVRDRCLNYKMSKLCLLGCQCNVSEQATSVGTLTSPSM